MPPQPARARRDDDFVEVRIVRDDRRGVGFDEVGDACAGIRAGAARGQRRREHDVADQAQTDQEDLRGALDRGFVDQHHRDVILDRIDAPALRALQRRAALDQLDLRLAVGARQNLEQFRVDGHMRTIIVIRNIMNLLPLVLCAFDGAACSPPSRRQPQETPSTTSSLGRYLEGAGKVDEAVAASARRSSSIRRAPSRAPSSPRSTRARTRRPKRSTRRKTRSRSIRRTRKPTAFSGSVLAALAEQRQPAQPGDDVRPIRNARWPPSKSRAATAPAISRSISRSRGSIWTQDRPADAIPLLRRIVIEQPQYSEGSVLLAEAQEAAGRPTPRSRR